MSAKTHFLKKLHAQSSSAGTSTCRSQTDISAFRQSMAQLQDTMTGWLAETGMVPESSPVLLADLLVAGGMFEIPGITLRHENRALRFIPLFLYGPGVTGCVEVSLHAEGKGLALSRLFMRAGECTHWTCTRLGALSVPVRRFDEEVFFEMLERVLP